MAAVRARRRQELDIVDGVIDSLDEDGDSPVPNITHRYPDRVLFLVSPVCATYCRFCTRRRKVGDPEKIPLNQYDSAFEYIRQHPEIRDVILSGGDPMMLSDRRLEYIFQKLREIPHVEIIRLGSRITSHLPSRITPEFCEMVKKYHPIYMNTHFNHPAELTPEIGRGARTAGRRRRSARLPDGAAARRERRSGDHEGADAEAPQGARSAVLHLYGRPGRGRRALPHDGREGSGDRQGAPRLDVAASPFRTS